MLQKELSLIALAKARLKLAHDIKARVGDLKDRAGVGMARQLDGVLA